MSEQAIDIVIRAKDEATKALNKVQWSAKALGWSMQEAWKIAMKSATAMSLALAWIVSFWVKSAVSLEQTRVAFENLYGDAWKARNMMQSLSDFAKKTPFEFPELTDVALKLKNVAWVWDQQLIPMLTNLGDIASSQWKGISQIVEAYNDAITGEYERLKEFGIKASKSGDDVTFSFKWQQKTVKATSEEIGRYLQEVGKMNGIAGAMDKQSMTLWGRLSTLKDQFKSLSMAIVWVSETWDIQAWGMFDRLSQAVAMVWSYLEQNQSTIIAWIQVITWAFSTAVDIIYNVLNQFFTGGTGNWVKFFESIKQTVQIWLWVIMNFWNKYWQDITYVMTTVFWAVKWVITNFFAYIMPFIQSALWIIGNIFKLFASLLRWDFHWAWEAMKGIVKSALEWIKNLVILGWNMLLWVFWTNMKELLANMKLMWEQLKTDVSTAFNDLVQSAKEWGWNMIQMLMDGIMEKWNSFKDTVAATSQVLADFLGFHSPTKKGAGKDSDKWMPNLINMLAIGLNEWKSVIEWKAKLIAESLASIGVKFKQSAISETLIKIADTAKWKFDEVINSIQGSVDKIKTLKTELEDINKTISDLTSKKWEAEKGGKMALANRALEIEKEISTLKADTETIGTEEWQKKLLALQEELTFANSFVSAQERAFAFSQASRSESQIILANMQEQMMAAQNEIYRATELAEAKKVQIKEEEELHKTLMQTKTDLDTQYFLLFNDRIEWVKNGIMQTIKLMQSLNAMSWWGGGASLWARAIWGTMMENQPYLVGERGPEIVIPKSSSTVVPNNEVRGGGMNVSINFGDISVRNDWDIREITRAVEDSLTRKLQLYRQGIA